jgi:hypothetical protein
MAPLLIDSLVTVTGTFCEVFEITCFKMLDSCFTQVDTANPDSGDVHFPHEPFSQSLKGRLELDETKPGSQQKTERVLPSSAPAF